MDRAPLLTAAFALVVLLATFPAVGSLRRALVEQDSSPTPPVDSKLSSNRTAAGSSGPPASPGVSTASNSSSTPPPVTKKNNSSLSPASPPAPPSNPSPLPRQPSPPAQKPPSEESRPPKPRIPRKPPSGGVSKPSPSGARSEAPAGGGTQSGHSKDANYDCAGVSQQRCPGNVTVCIWHPKNDTKERFILVQNKGSGNVVVSSSLSVDPTPVNIRQNASQKIKLRSDTDPSSVTLNVGGKSCSLSSTSAASVDKFIQQLPAYATPAYGAYAALFLAMVAGGSWACCKCRKRSRRVESGIPYQQLEMGVQESTSAVDANGDGWDQGWDDDWEDEDEETGSRTKDTRQEGRVPANTNRTSIAPSRAPARDEWEDWDD